MLAIDLSSAESNSGSVWLTLIAFGEGAGEAGDQSMVSGQEGHQLARGCSRPTVPPLGAPSGGSMRSV